MTCNRLAAFIGDNARSGVRLDLALGCPRREGLEYRREAPAVVDEGDSVGRDVDVGRSVGVSLAADPEL
jgi:hypothetical protein